MTFVVSPPCAEHREITTPQLYVTYDTGETVPFIELMAQDLRDRVEFRIIGVGSSDNTLKKAPAEILERRISLEALGVPDKIDPKDWPRERAMSEKGLVRIQKAVRCSLVMVGSASKIQAQILSSFPTATKICFVDNFDYNVKDPSFTTVEAVRNCADIVLCPCSHTANLLKKTDGSTRKYVVVGSPTLESWMKQVKEAEGHKEEILKKLCLTADKPIIAFMDGYDGSGSTTYKEIISPLFKKLADTLRERGYQVVIQPHPKVSPQIVSTPELLAVSQYVIGYNSSTVFCSLALGKKCLYLIPELPDGKTFSHFSIDKGYAPAIRFTPDGGQDVASELLGLLDAMKNTPAPDVFSLEKFPRNSIETIERIKNKYLAAARSAMPQDPEETAEPQRTKSPDAAVTAGCGSALSS